MKLEKDCWYWVSDPREGDIFAPILATSENELIMDDKKYSIDDIGGMNIEKAIMPDT